MYRLIVESLLGLHREGTSLRLEPCIPAGWPGFTIRYRFGDTVYRITVTQVAGEARKLSLDGVEQQGHSIPLQDDHGIHQVELRLPGG